MSGPVPCPAAPASITECCLAPIPNTSEFGVVCPGDTWTAPAAVVPTLSDLGLALLAVGIIALALRRLR